MITIKDFAEFADVSDAKAHKWIKDGYIIKDRDGFIFESYGEASEWIRQNTYTYSILNPGEILKIGKTSYSPEEK